ncbi:flagellar motor switch protein FliM [Tistrella bauzanensis]|uniref:Flagellar motor switch protein FliM n=1 Tax=Tistrella bauzanensis TaxID=657419 RepID=A0ABQ1I9J0_9PROT|nr:flagellar motor switch protein FliM [Tistrella bauzanensis]GGB25871.1 flagellar motor switch protein FliM [Tistrella bauzanensis]
MADPNDEDGSPDDDAIAAEWEAMMAADEAGAGEGGQGDVDALFAEEGTRALSQDEIDSLLGFDQGDEGDEERSGIRAIINSSLVSYERLPMLEVVFDRLQRQMTTSMRNFTSDNVEVSLDSTTSIRFGDYLNSIPLPAMIAVFKAEEWDNYGLVTVDSSLIYSIVDVLLGGRRGTTIMRIEGRPYTTIERNLVEQMIRVVLNDLSAAFDPLSPVNMKFERLETNPRFATIARAANAAIVARFRVDMDDRGGRLEILMPYATLEPVRELLLQMFMGEKFGRDTIWETHLAQELWYTNVTVEALLDEQTLTLGEVMRFKVGTTLKLNARPQSDVLMRCGSVPLARGRLGRVMDNIAVQLKDSVRKSKMTR